jgi:hypothetical protein
MIKPSMPANIQEIALMARRTYDLNLRSIRKVSLIESSYRQGTHTGHAQSTTDINSGERVSGKVGDHSFQGVQGIRAK